MNRNLIIALGIAVVVALGAYLWLQPEPTPELPPVEDEMAPEVETPEPETDPAPESDTPADDGMQDDAE